jgi:GDP-L-fucose synthase
MDVNARIYVAGHTGLIGSAVVRKLKSMDYRNIITRTHKELDLTEGNRVAEFFKKEGPEYVFLAAARVGGIYANSTFPAEFIYENLMIQRNVIDLSYRYGVKKLLFLASSCIYPKMCKQPMREGDLLTGPIEQTNEPFGIAKIAGIKMCEAYNKQYGTNFISIVPANVYGVNDHFVEDGHVVASLIKNFHEAKVKGNESVTIWGTGRPKREFFYVDDVAEACMFLMDQYNESEPINAGTGLDTSVADLAELVKRTVGFKGNISYDTTKPDGNPARLLDISRITALGWKFKITLEEGLRMTYDWFKQFIVKQ